MQEQINKLEKTVKQTSDDVKEIKAFLIGNDYINNGLVQRVDTVEKYQNKDKKQKWMVLGGVSVLVALKEFGNELVDFFKI